MLNSFKKLKGAINIVVSKSVWRVDVALLKNEYHDEPMHVPLVQMLV